MALCIPLEKPSKVALNSPDSYQQADPGRIHSVPLIEQQDTLERDLETVLYALYGPNFWIPDCEVQPDYPLYT